MGFAGALIGSKASYSITWYGVLFDTRWEILTGATIGLAFGFAFSPGLAERMSSEKFVAVRRKLVYKTQFDVRVDS
jgi:hypothetical protein